MFDVNWDEKVKTLRFWSGFCEDEPVLECMHGLVVRSSVVLMFCRRLDFCCVIELVFEEMAC